MLRAISRHYVIEPPHSYSGRGSSIFRKPSLHMVSLLWAWRSKRWALLPTSRRGPRLMEPPALGSTQPFPPCGKDLQPPGNLRSLTRTPLCTGGSLYLPPPWKYPTSPSAGVWICPQGKTNWGPQSGALFAPKKNLSTQRLSLNGANALTF